MEGSAGNRGAVRVMVVLLVFGWQTCALARRITVGGTKGWSQNVNYSEWSRDQHIYVGDWLYFVFDKRYLNVLEVNKTSYEDCNDKGFITNITRGGRDVFQLKEARPYYFLSGGGFCFGGMKVAVDVQTLPSPAPAPAANGSPSVILSQAILPTLLAIAFVLAVIFKPSVG